MDNYAELSECRIAKTKRLATVFSLGKLAMSGVFKKLGEEVPVGPLDLVFSPDSGLVQLKQTYDLKDMYGETYGYRTGLNKSMEEHIQSKAKLLADKVGLTRGDTVLDIGSNDGTLLNAYPDYVNRVGIDPTLFKFEKYYRDGAIKVSQFFNKEAYFNAIKEKARIITTIAMLYDLPDPRAFVRDIKEVLADDGIWHTEQSYLPLMLKQNAYDTVCHEHLEYYSLGVLKDLFESEGLKILDVTTNAVNGGSFALTIAHDKSQLPVNEGLIQWMLREEKRMKLDKIEPYILFTERVMKLRNSLQDLLATLTAQGKTVLGYGASTKGNVLLQYSEIDNKTIPAIIDVNSDKWDKVTPGTNIQIVSENEGKLYNPDYLLVLPWHFKNGILQREKEYMKNGGKFIFPLPNVEVV